MESLILHEIKHKASCFFRDKIKSARLIFTDVTPVELMTEEATNENPWLPDSRTLRIISQAAFEVDDYWRIVEIIHNRLLNFDKRNWRGSYNALILVNHLLTHGPLRVSEEFQSDESAIEELGQLQYIDERGFNWGTRVRNLSERVIKLLKNTEFLREERGRGRQVSRGIVGFGSFNKRTSETASHGSFNKRTSETASHGSFNAALPSKKHTRCNSHYEYEGYEYHLFNDDEQNNSHFGEDSDFEDHPFVDNKQTFS